MKTTAIHGWPIAEATDPVKQYPTAVDEPFKTALDGQLTPIGALMPYAGATAPSRWLLCDGAAVSRTTYARLFGVIGTTFGAGDGSTTFNVPNMLGRVPIGRDPAQPEVDVLGEAGGAKTHTHPVANPVSRQANKLSTMDPSNNTLFPGARVRSSAATNVTLGPSDMVSSAQDRYTYDTDAGSTLQPYLTLNFIIRT